jgi:hypothetical protein
MEMLIYLLSTIARTFEHFDRYKASVMSSGVYAITDASGKLLMQLEFVFVYDL